MPAAGVPSSGENGRVWLSTDEPLKEGMFIRVYLDAVVDGDLSGYPVEEEV